MSRRRVFREHQAALQSAKRSPLWQSTFACTQVTTRQARAYCDALKTLEAKQPRSTSTTQANVFADLFGLPAHTAGTLLSLYLAITCEVISALGLFAVVHTSLKPERTSPWQTLTSLLRRRRQPPITPPSSDSDASSTIASPTSASKPSSTSSRGSWQKPKSLDVDVAALFAADKPRRASTSARIAFRDPLDPTQTWSGRGRPPKWLQDYLDAGRDKDEFVIA